MKIEKKYLTALNEAKKNTKLDEAMYGIEIEKTPLYKECEKIVRKVSTKVFKGKCLYVGSYNSHKGFYDEFAVKSQEISKARDIIYEEASELVRPYLGLDGYISDLYAQFNEDGKFEIDIDIKFNESGKGLPQFRFRMYNDRREPDAAFSNNSVGSFSKMEEFIEILENIKDFYNELIK